MFGSDPIGCLPFCAWVNPACYLNGAIIAYVNTGPAINATVDTKATENGTVTTVPGR